jgi:hypothetical protein
VWNIANFGINKFNNPFHGRTQWGAGGLTQFQASKWREQVFARVLHATQPDIIAVIEVSSGDSTPNHLATLTGGMEGCVYVLNALRATPAFAAGNWRLVPPLRIGQGGKAESVGVFFRGTTGGVTRYFTGPNIWTGGLAGQSVRPGLGVAAAYPAGGNPDIDAMLVPPAAIPVPARVIPAGAQYNVGLAEDQVAARTQFQLINAANGAPAGNLNFLVFREPYMVSFFETGGAAPRNLTLFVVHSPAVTGNQAVFITYLANAYEIAAPNGANETRVITGDFNLNLLDPAGNDAHTYDDLTVHPAPAARYRLLIQPAGLPPPAANLPAYTGYFATHVRRAPTHRTALSKFLWSQTLANTADYPSYGYVGSQFVANLYSIDNLLVRPYNGAHPYNTTIMNPVVGTPFNAVPAPPGAPPIGILAMGNAFMNVIGGGWPPAPNAPVFTLPGASNLCSWANYGHIYSTSDHFALYADV